jgi:hypothetical protein
MCQARLSRVPAIIPPGCHPGDLIVTNARIAKPILQELVYGGPDWA